MKKIVLKFKTPEEFIEQAKKLIERAEELKMLRDSEVLKHQMEYQFIWDSLKNEHE